MNPFLKISNKLNRNRTLAGLYFFSPLLIYLVESRVIRSPTDTSAAKGARKLIKDKPLPSGDMWLKLSKESRRLVDCEDDRCDISVTLFVHGLTKVFSLTANMGGRDGVLGASGQDGNSRA